MLRKPIDRWREVDEELRHIRGLVFIRKLLAERGATSAELHECDFVIEDSRRRLARVALRDAA